MFAIKKLATFLLSNIVKGLYKRKYIFEDGINTIG